MTIMIKRPKRRRQEFKTNYSRRLKLLKSKTPRIVFRKSNKYIIAQLVSSKEAQDKVELGISSKNLLSYGWPKEASKSLKTLPAAYLTGYLIGKKIKVDKGVVDFGLNRNVHKSKIYAFIKGLQDAGVKVTEKENAFPEEDRIKGKYMKNESVTKNFDSILKRIGEEK